MLVTDKGKNFDLFISSRTYSHAIRFRGGERDLKVGRTQNTFEMGGGETTALCVSMQQLGGIGGMLTQEILML